MDQKILSRYNSAEGAASYRKKFERKLAERINNWHEQRLVRRLLDLVPNAKRALDMPTGCGRMAPLIKEKADELVMADWSFNMLQIAREDVGFKAGVVRLTALELPFRDKAFDLAFSIRLCHHIREHEERLKYVRELLRVTRQTIIFTYFSSRSLKSRMRNARQKLGGRKRQKWTLDPAEITELADGAGFDVATSVPLSRVFSGHVYTVLTAR